MIKALGPEQKPKIVVVKSTVPVGTTHKVRDAIREIVGPDVPFAVADNPEFLKEGAAVRDFNYPDRVILGVDDEETGVVTRQLYEPFRSLGQSHHGDGCALGRDGEIRLQQFLGDQNFLHQRNGRPV